MAAPAVSFRKIGKRFPGVAALDDVSFDIGAGSCHAICGENGAGKSTLSRILAGIAQPDDGEILIDDTPVHFGEPRDALAAGVAMVHQELVFCENLSVEENLFLGDLPARRTLLDRPALRQRALALLDSLNVAIDPAARVETLSVAQQQLVQIAAAVGSGARIIIFDEPTSSLGEREVEQLYTLIDALRARGVTLIYISHRMPEIFRLCDTITVLRDGRHVSTEQAAALDERAVVQQMIGRELTQYFPEHERMPPGAELLNVANYASPGRFHDIALTLHAGEVVGLAGLTGAGRSELAQALFGLDPAATGDLHVDGKPVELSTPQDALAAGIGLVPEDRKRQGLVLGMLGRENVTLPIVDRLARWTWIRRDEERQVAASSASRVHARSDALETAAMTLSGGNQQKLVLARWLAARSRILILDEPTRGVDVGAKAELHAWIDRLAASGTAILLISSELPELLNLSRRIVVLREGTVAGELSRAEATQERLLGLMAGLAD
ncbi:MAG TPA: sugar ABC transporter ATP-binding protein [Gemmatimonadales bacterium]|jgi:ABC-type sugar transport system ATPase subunit